MHKGSETPPLKRFDSRRGEHCAVLLRGLGGTHRYWTCGPVPFALLGHRTVLIDLLGFGMRHIEQWHSRLAERGPASPAEQPDSERANGVGVAVRP